ncbi:helix-turn-helix transcriptional regulator [Streptomyces longwoodensis]|uniref:helix-turn-helix domain-containing protein n=1 Tax=Streptomyces longwoodensis TaxID=68231 RepID=UPI0033CA22CF
MDTSIAVIAITVVRFAMPPQLTVAHLRHDPGRDVFMRLQHPERFEELVRLKGLSQRRLAEQAHVSQAFISLMASGQRGVKPVTAWRVASVLGVYTSELFVPDTGENGLPMPTGEDPPHPGQRNRLYSRHLTPAGRRPGTALVPTPARRSRRCPSVPTRLTPVSTPV